MKKKGIKIVASLITAIFFIAGCQSKKVEEPEQVNALVSMDVLDIFPTDGESVGVQVHFELDQMIAKDKIHLQEIKFSHEIVVTFEGVDNKLENKPGLNGTALISDMSVREVNDNTQMIFDFDQPIEYSYTLAGKDVTVTFFPKTPASTARELHRLVTGARYQQKPGGGGDVIVNVAGASDLHVESTKDPRMLDVHIDHVRVSEDVDRSQDVDKLGSLIKKITVEPDTTGAVIRIETKSNFSEEVKRFNDKIIISMKPSNLSAISEEVDKANSYKGKPVNFHFQDIEVSALLQLIADFSEVNIVVSDTVKGTLSLNLNNTPWDQVLDIVMQSQGLGMRRYGDIVLVAPSTELAEREFEDLQANERIESLAPLYTEIIHLHYAKAEEVKSLVQDGGSLLTTRGQLNVDSRTNTVWVRDTAAALEEIRNLINRLDVVVPQVLIEARVVTINSDYDREIGARLGITRDKSLTGSTTQTGALPPELIPLNDRLGFNFPADGVGEAGGAASLGLTLFKIDSRTLLDLEVSALEKEGKASLVSSPRLVTSNQQEAMIQTGEEIPYEESTSSGATNIAFKKAVLSLTVTPRITPDDKIILDLKITEDKRGEVVTVGGPPAIDTQAITTQVLLNNGETVVLGGVRKRGKLNDVDQVPLLGQVPILGNLFKHTRKIDNKDELLIFITPRVIENS